MNVFDINVYNKNDCLRYIGIYLINKTFLLIFSGKKIEINYEWCKLNGDGFFFHKWQ